MRTNNSNYTFKQPLLSRCDKSGLIFSKEKVEVAKNYRQKSENTPSENGPKRNTWFFFSSTRQGWQISCHSSTLTHLQCRVINQNFSGHNERLRQEQFNFFLVNPFSVFCQLTCHLWTYYAEAHVQLAGPIKFQNKRFLISWLLYLAPFKLVETTLSLLFDLLIALWKTGLIINSCISVCQRNNIFSIRLLKEKTM